MRGNRHEDLNQHFHWEFTSFPLERKGKERHSYYTKIRQLSQENTALSCGKIELETFSMILAFSVWLCYNHIIRPGFPHILLMAKQNLTSTSAGF